MADSTSSIYFMREAIRLARANVANTANGPFGAVIVKDRQIVAQGVNRVIGDQDPTAHAEIVAIRQACAVLETHDLSGCDIYSSCEPCPMCLAAIYWARISRLWFGSSREDAAVAGFDDAVIYEEIGRTVASRRLPTTQLVPVEANQIFLDWTEKKGRILY